MSDYFEMARDLPHVSMQYGHWGITVSKRRAASDYAPFESEFFAYPCGPQGPIDSAETERAAIAYCRSLGGEVKGPFFYREEVPKRIVSSIECPHCHWGFAPSVIDQHIREKH